MLENCLLHEDRCTCATHVWQVGVLSAVDRNRNNTFVFEILESLGPGFFFTIDPLNNCALHLQLSFLVAFSFAIPRLCPSVLGISLSLSHLAPLPSSRALCPPSSVACCQSLQGQHGAC